MSCRLTRSASCLGAVVVSAQALAQRSHAEVRAAAAAAFSSSDSRTAAHHPRSEPWLSWVRDQPRVLSAGASALSLGMTLQK